MSKLNLLLFVLFLFAALNSVSAEENIPKDPNLFVLLSDIHIRPQDFQWEYARHNDQKLTANINTILQMNPRPAHVLIYGDFSFNDGNIEDYTLVKKILKQLDDAGIPWSGVMGNHDKFDNFVTVFPERKNTEVQGKSNYFVELPNAIFILMDSTISKKVNGNLDQAQLDWLKKYLHIACIQRNTQKQIFVGAHHPIDEMEHCNEFCEILRSCKDVQGYIFGHTHRWEISMYNGVPTFNIPSCAYISKKMSESPRSDDWPLGFMTLRLGRQFNTFTLYTNNKDHRLNGTQWIVPVRNPRIGL